MTSWVRWGYKAWGIVVECQGNLCTVWGAGLGPVIFNSKFRVQGLGFGVRIHGSVFGIEASGPQEE